MIRQLVVSDVVNYWNLRLKALSEHPDVFGASYEEVKDTPIESVKERFSSTEENFILGAFKGEELIGMVGFRREQLIKMKHKGIIWGMYVNSNFQGKGIGKELVIELIRKAKQLKELEQINLFVVDRNQRAKALYESIGFKSFGKEINAMKVGDNYLNEELMVYII
ncbi:GNAT family N-acetyltransferase [Cohnella suwonensis]|uniref:GNAT family N-acetyltransferase n=1 Tax=Cohnella suwonensis TaxID=696072 RepID=A0ABW0M048_9BACL